MKVKNTTKDKRFFKPQTIEIVIEDLADLAWLYGCANTSLGNVKSNCDSHPILQNALSDENHGQPQMAFYDLINNVRKANDIY